MAFSSIHAAVPLHSAVIVHTYPGDPNASTEGANDSVELRKTRPATGQDGSRPKPPQAVARSVNLEAAGSVAGHETKIDPRRIRQPLRRSWRSRRFDQFT